MNMDIALLRKRVVQLMDRGRGQWPLGSPSTPDLALPPFTPDIFKLAHIAVGDPDSAAVLTVDVLLTAPADEGDALRALLAHLPAGWHSWPSGAGPREWLSLRLRREQADRLLSVIGEWRAVDRIALALHLLWDVRRDELDRWLGTSGMSDRIALVLEHVAASLNLLPTASTNAECREFASDLLDAHDVQVGRSVRLHLLGCDTCRGRAAGVQRAAQIMRQAFHVFFRAPVPTDWSRVVRLRRLHWQQVRWQRWRPVLIGVALVVLCLGTVRPSRSSAPTASTPVALPSAMRVLDQAINRFDAAPALTGVLHERVRLGDGTNALILERWHNYQSPHQLRITLRRDGEDVPRFDLRSNGTNALSYSIDPRFGQPEQIVMRSPAVADIMPIVRQLPAVGTYGAALVDPRNTDLALLLEAQRAQPTLLGTTMWQDRPAYMVASTTANRSRQVLTIDQATHSLLSSRLTTHTPGATAIQRHWQAEVVEVLSDSELPDGTFNVPFKGGRAATAINPRQLGLWPLTPMDINIARAMRLPVPKQLPEPTVLSYVRTAGEYAVRVSQIYEGQWSTLAIVTPPRNGSGADIDPLDRTFAHGRYLTYSDAAQQTTYAEFVLDGYPEQRIRLYLWHAFADDTEREEMVKRTLDSLVMIDTDMIQAHDSSFMGALHVLPVARRH